MKVWKLIEKDMILCPGGIATGILISILAPIYFKYISNINEIFIGSICLFGAILACNLTISRFCYIEDDYATKRLLASMPVRALQYVFARYVTAFAVNFAFILLTFLEGIILEIDISCAATIFVFSAGIIYESVYLFLFYKWGANIAQYAFAVIILIAVGIYLLASKWEITTIPVARTNSFTIFFVIGGIILFIISGVGSSKLQRDM